MHNQIFRTLLFFTLLAFLSSSWRVAAAENVETFKVNSPAQASYSLFRVSIATNGAQGDSHSDSPSISADGRYVAFTSYATTLVPDDTNGVQDVFVHDRQTGQTTRVSVASGGAQGDKLSTAPSISADGRFVAFTSYATNFASGTSGQGDIFVHDRLLGETEFISIATGELVNNKGSAHPSISADGRYVAFSLMYWYPIPEYPDDLRWYSVIYVRDRLTLTTQRITPILLPYNDHLGENSFLPMISADGRFVTFSSNVTVLLVPGDNNFKEDIFVYTMQTGEFTRVSVASNGAEANDHSYTPVISADGRLVAFMSAASNLVTGDTNDLPDIFVHDRDTGQTQRVSIAADGTQTSGQPADSRLPSISADGRYVAFQSDASNLVPVDTNNSLDVFLYDLQSGDIRIVSTAYDGSQGDWQSMSPSVSADGRFVAFGSSAHNLVADDTNNKRDIFVCDGEKNIKVFLPMIIQK